LAAELKQAFTDAEIRLVQSSGGVFEVTVDGTLLFSKKALRRHAEPGEILGLIRRAHGQTGGRAGG
jgi:selT/selW/selH-like putative selenoprotein